MITLACLGPLDQEPSLLPSWNALHPFLRQQKNYISMKSVLPIVIFQEKVKNTALPSSVFLYDKGRRLALKGKCG